MRLTPEEYQQLQGRVARNRETAVAPGTISTDEQLLNKTEKAYLQYLRALGYQVMVTPFTLKLAHDTRYTPDLVYVDANAQIVCVEIKGFMRDDANVKLKTAARMFCKLFRFHLVRKDKANWVIQPVAP